MARVTFQPAGRTVEVATGTLLIDAAQVEAWGGFRLDVTKLTISVKGVGLTGYAASALLNTEFGIQVEMADLYNVLVIVSIGDRRNR